VGKGSSKALSCRFVGAPIEKKFAAGGAEAQLLFDKSSLLPMIYMNIIASYDNILNSYGSQSLSPVPKEICPVIIFL
jgi:hypothetical protein